MKTLLVRLKPYDPRRGYLLRRFTYRGIKFQCDRGWYRVAPDVAGYLATVRQNGASEFSPLAFDVCAPEEAKALDEREQESATTRTAAADDIKLSEARRTPETAASETPDEPRPKPTGRRAKKG